MEAAGVYSYFQFAPEFDELTPRDCVGGRARAVLELLLERKEDDRTLVFVQRRETAQNLACVLKAAGEGTLSVDVIVGKAEMSSRARARQLFKFKGNVFNVLVATSVLEEGIDFVDCNQVIHFDRITSLKALMQS